MLKLNKNKNQIFLKAPKEVVLKVKNIKPKLAASPPLSLSPEGGGKKIGIRIIY
jgi:hypothetical protein